MRRFFQRTFLILALGGAVFSAKAFSLLGPPAAWQVELLSYNLGFNQDVGAPMNLGEEYRWNINKITYGFDESFLNYFGSRGTAAVIKAIAILNDLPPTSQMSASLSEFPTDTRRFNYQASALALFDMKSTALGVLMEELGLASPERYVFTLRARTTGNNVTNYLVIRRNFDPVTFVPSSYVNDVLYTYYIDEFPTPVHHADAIELSVDPFVLSFRSIATTFDGLWNTTLRAGEFFTGLTRDDVGGLRYLYGSSGNYRNLNIENLLPDTTAGIPDCPYCPPGTGTNSTSTNAVVDLALRPGVDKITFQLGAYDSLFGFFITLTNQYEDRYVTQSTLLTQTTRRVLTQPDILFSAEDLGNTLVIRRTDTTSWINNDAVNGQANLDGPGVIPPQVVITFSKLGPSLGNSTPYFLDESSAGRSGLWASFDGTTNAPVIFPDGISIQDLERIVLGGY